MIIPSKIHLACAHDQLRPALQAVAFRSGYAYASDGHVLIRQSLRLWELEEGEDKILNGRQIHYKIFAQLIKKDVVILNALKEGVEALTDCGRILYPYYSFDGKIPKYEEVLKMSKKESVEAIGFNGQFIENLRRAMYFYGFDHSLKLEFYGKTKAILIKAVNVDLEDQKCILMPVSLENFE